MMLHLSWTVLLVKDELTRYVYIFSRNMFEQTEENQENSQVRIVEVWVEFRTEYFLKRSRKPSGLSQPALWDIVAIFFWKDRKNTKNVIQYSRSPKLDLNSGLRGAKILSV
jgi:hypothetical protein